MKTERKKGGEDGWEEKEERKEGKVKKKTND